MFAKLKTRFLQLKRWQQALIVLFALGTLSAPFSKPVTSGSTEGPEASEKPSSRCVRVSSEKLQSILPLTAGGGGTLRNGWAVKSSDFQSVYFLAAEMDFPGAEGDGEIGVWATGSLEATVGFFSVNGLAIEFSQWGDGSKTDAQLSISDDGASEAEQCVKSSQ